MLNYVIYFTDTRHKMNKIDQLACINTSVMYDNQPSETVIGLKQ